MYMTCVCVRVWLPIGDRNICLMSHKRATLQWIAVAWWTETLTTIPAAAAVLQAQTEEGHQRPVRQQPQHRPIQPMQTQIVKVSIIWFQFYLFLSLWIILLMNAIDSNDSVRGKMSTMCLITMIDDDDLEQFHSQLNKCLDMDDDREF